MSLPFYNDYAAKMQGLLGDQSIFRETRPAVLIPKFGGNGYEQKSLVNAPGPSPLKAALDAALASTNIFSADSSTKTAAGKVATDVSAGARKAIEAGAKSVSAAGDGIKSGFRWTVIIFFGAIALYLFLLLRPFVPGVNK